LDHSIHQLSKQYNISHSPVNYFFIFLSSRQLFLGFQVTKHFLCGILLCGAARDE